MVRKLKSRDTKGVVNGIEVAVADAFRDTNQLNDMKEGRAIGMIYSRRGCPVQHPAENRLAELEHAEKALVFCSGMAAVSTTLSTLLKKGDHVILTDDGNVTIRGYFSTFLPKFGVEVTKVPIDDMKNIREYARGNTALFFSEFPTNPFLRVIDLKAVADFAKEKGITTIIDSTFASPFNINPLDYGIDLVLHSATKYLGGHHDLTAGAVAGDARLMDKVTDYRNMMGTNLAPFDSYLLNRSIYTFELTMEHRNQKAMEIAKYLDRHPKVERVWYPGCESHPDYELAKRQLRGFGGVIPFELKASEEKTGRFIDELAIPYLAHNFGGCTSTIEQHVLFTHYGDRAEAEKRGIKGNLIRYSVGFEDIKDIIGDFENAFRSI